MDIKLTDLDPRFLRYEMRMDEWDEVDRQPGTGETCESVPHHHVSAMRVFWPHAENIADCQGIEFLCPKCFEENHGPVGTHAVVCWSKSRGIPDDASPGPGRWLIQGTSFEDLTLEAEPGKSRSVLLIGGCGWHGFITNGRVT